MLADHDALTLLRNRKPNHALEQPLYCDPGVFQADLDQLWYKDWLFAIPACEIPKTGNFVTMQVGAYPVVIVRGADKQIRAFHNVCRHRGQRLCSVVKGSSPKLVCPYHQWTYELDGRLLYARDMDKGFDPAAHGLKPVHCAVAGGLVFISLAKDAPAFEPLGASLNDYLAPHMLDEAKVVHTSTIVENGNWKLVIENNRECYHCGGNHPSLCRTFSDKPVITAPNDLGEATEVTRHWDRCEAAGLPSRFLLHPTAQWRLARVPLLDGAESYTMDTKRAVAKPLGRMPFFDAGSLLFFHYPNSWNHFLGDHAIVFRILPLTPTTTEVTTKWIVHKDAVEGVDFDMKRMTEVWLATNDEDRRVVEENQAGILSPAYEPGPYSSLHEDGVIQFIDWYANTMIQRLSPQPSAMAAE
ncbi:aromatic ring-hydroxylating dioxygenase subunit alpha [Fertoebacter nigrum]|uniref:Aromatic ring-hydroxylating dioxygenase subunit alpha n=1 Tax=Fertoeibacter niger TaxID=2656921 RepID=A0A8X8H301_9RHOB|nr:aromatic ring-hydroxylating dioxygenase subunit alpha [Fertoeibacter niger]NUB46225.1 aromatic ring-hydroxylating dioxygenase subunit alpha [Fertoeibacter niger]